MYTLLDGVEKNNKYPYSYFIPSKEDIDQLKVGDHVKLSFHEDDQGEKMWVQIFVIDENTFHGQLDNVPVLMKTIKYRDIVVFERKNIIGVT